MARRDVSAADGREGAAGEAIDTARSVFPVGVLGPTPPGDRPSELLPWLAEPLRRLLAPGQPAHHAWLVQGPAGIGQFEFAVAVAQSALCETPAASRPDGGLACGRCPGCRLVQAQTHPDLLVLLPEVLREPLRHDGGSGTEGGEGDGGEGGSTSKRRAPSRELKVDDLRRAVGFAQTTAARGGAKVVVVHPAERMNAIAANALLKTLEEPPPQVRFVLSTGDAARLMPTIRSRCRAVVLDLPPANQALPWLEQQGVAHPDVLLAAAGGQPLRVLELLADGIDAEAWRRFPARVLQGDSAALQGWPLPRLIDALLRLCLDTQRQRLGQAPRHFPFLAARAAGAGSVDKGGSPSLQALNDWGTSLLQAARHAEHPVHLPLAIDALVAEGRLALQPPGANLAANPATNPATDRRRP
jgi:DNA polymerase III subunit delta'